MTRGPQKLNGRGEGGPGRRGPWRLGGRAAMLGVRLRVARESGAPCERIKTLLWGLQWPQGCEKGTWHSPTWNKDEAWGLV